MTHTWKAPLNSQPGGQLPWFQNRPAGPDAPLGNTPLVPVFVTPEMAREILAGPVMKNRHLRKTVVDRYARDISTDKWPLLPDFIAFRAEDGALCDGQHRLHAIMKANKGLWLYVARELSAEQVAALDKGVSRKVSDVATIVYDVPYAVATTAQCRIVHFLVTGVESYEITGEDVSDAYRAHQGTFDLVNGVNKSKFRCLPASVLAAVVFTHPRDPEASEMFLRGLATGADLPAASPVLWLRNQLLNKTNLVLHHQHDRCHLALIAVSAIMSLAQGGNKAHHVKPVALETAQRRYLTYFLQEGPWPGV